MSLSALFPFIAVGVVCFCIGATAGGTLMLALLFEKETDA